MEEFSLNDFLAEERFEFSIGVDLAGRRLDQFLGQIGAELDRPISRSMFTSLIRRGDVLVNNRRSKSSYRLRRGDKISVSVPPPEPINLEPEPVDFETVYEDADIIVICKPPNLVVHPACGHQNGTLVHGLLYHCNDLTGINGTVRPGIVHRLDKDTSGLLVVAKNDLSQRDLVRQFKEKTVEKIYLAIVNGCPEPLEGTITGNIGRHPVNRKKMAVLPRGGREAVTHWQVVEKLGEFSLVKLRLETGRTHQIRVHLASIGTPIAGDTIYGRKKQNAAELKIQRQCLHAAQLSFFHPKSKERMTFHAPLTADMEYTLSILRQRYGEA